MTSQRSAWKRVRLVEQLEAEERRDLRKEDREERCLDGEDAVERGDVLSHAAEVLVERREARVLEVRRVARTGERVSLDKRDERRLEAAVAIADKDVDEVVAPGRQSVQRLHPWRSSPTRV